VDLIILTSPNPSKGGELYADVDLNTDLKSPFWGDLEGSKRKNRKSKWLIIPCLLLIPISIPFVKPVLVNVVGGLIIGNRLIQQALVFGSHFRGTIGTVDLVIGYLLLRA